MSKLNMIKCSDLELWRSFVSKSPQGSIFMWPEILVATGKSVHLWLGYLGNEIVIGVPVFADPEELDYLDVPYFNYYGPMLSPIRSQMPCHRKQIWTVQVLNDCLECLSKEYKSLNFRCSPELDDVRAFQWFNYHSPEKGQYNLCLNYTAVINLDQIKDIDSYMLGIRKSRRHDFKKALSNGIRIEKQNDENAQKILFHLQHKTYARQGLEITYVEQKVAETMVQNALGSDVGEILIAFDENNTPVSAAFLLWDAYKAYYLIAANDPEYRHLGANTALIIDGIQRAIDRELHEFDFIGANSPQRGDFKLSFGAELHPHFACAWQGL